MADFNAINRPWLAAGVPRLFGVDMPRVPVVGSEVQIVASPWDLPEQWALLGGGLGSGSFSQVGAVAACVGLYNPPSSGVLVCVDKAILYNANGTNGGFQVGVYKGFLTTVTSNWQNRDMRRVSGVQAQGGLVAQLQSQDNPALVGAARLAQVGILGASTFTWDSGVVLAPGWLFWALMVTGAGTLHTTFIGRERPVPESELSL